MSIKLAFIVYKKEAFISLFFVCDKIKLMIIVILVLIGLCLGSFVNALVWRLKKQEELEDSRSELAKKHKTPNSKLLNPNFSILRGRSMCPNCKHQLAALDLIPVFSWIILKAKCRYCHKKISWQYPLVELLMALLFVVSYIFWPTDLQLVWQYVNFVSWLIILVGLVALAVYDIKWMILPDKIVFLLIGIALFSIMIQLLTGRPINDLYGIIWSVIIGGGIFWVIFQVSKGKWIGGGDVKLGFLLGLLVAKPEYAFLLLFLASLIAMLFTMPLLITKKLKKDSKVPFGPFLITACFITVLFGDSLLNAYKSLLGL